MAVAAIIMAAASTGSAQSAALSRYLGASNSSSTRDVAWDSDGNLYTTGGVAIGVNLGGTRLPRVAPDAPAGVWGAHDVWVAKWSPTGTILLLGGPNYDRAYAIAVNDTGVYLAGRAGDGFPTTTGALQDTFAGDNDQTGLYGLQDGFVTKLDHDGHLVWSTYFGESSPGFLRDVVVDSLGHAYVAETGVSEVNPHVTTGAYEATLPAGTSAVIAKLSVDGTEVEWGTYLGGSGSDMVNPSIRLDRHGNVYVAGHSDADDFPTTRGTYQAGNAGGYDITLCSLSPDGGTLRFSRYFGGSSGEVHETHSLAVGVDRVFLTGSSNSSDIATSPDVVDRTYEGGSEAFVAAFDLNGVHQATTYLGGSGDDSGEGIDVAPNGNVVITGATRSSNFSTTTTMWEGSDHEDGFLVVLSSDLTTLEFSARIGGSAEDRLRATTVSATGRVAVGGITWADDYPVDSSSAAWSNDGTGGYWDQIDAVFGVFDLPQTLR